MFACPTSFLYFDPAGRLRTPRYQMKSFSVRVSKSKTNHFGVRPRHSKDQEFFIANIENHQTSNTQKKLQCIADASLQALAPTVW